VTYLHCGITANPSSGASESISKGGGKFHGDLKPTNVLVKMGSDRPFAQLCDFDFAGESRSGGTIPTMSSQANYVAPEIATGVFPVDKEANRSMRVKGDIYSLGLTMYQMKTGITPFTNLDGGLTLRGLLYKVSRDSSIFDNYAPKEHDAISEELYGLLGRCWSINPSHRPPMEEVARTFRQVKL